MTMTTPAAPVRRTHGEQSTPAAVTLPLDVCYGPRNEPAVCGICGNAMPPMPPGFELVLADDADGETPICGPCSHATHKPLAAALIFLTALTRAYEAGDTHRVGEAVQAVLAGLDAWHDFTGTPIPNAAPVPARRPRTAPVRRRGGRRRR